MSLLRAATLCLVALASAGALAAPLRLVPFTNRCFDDAQLAARLRTHALVVEVGPTSARSGQHVEVRGTEALEVRIEARDDEGRVVGLETRRIPDGPCDALLETAELVVVRAATPLHFILDEPKPRPRAPRRVGPVVPSVAEQRVVEQPAQPAPIEQPAPVEPVRQALAPVVVVAPVPLPPRAAPFPRASLRIELSLHGLWLFPLDDAPSAVAGDAEIAIRWSRRLGLGVHAGVAHRWVSIDHSGDSGASLDVRRIPFAVLLEVALGLRHGEMRIGAGPLVEVWRVESSSVSQPRTRAVAQPGLEVRAAYRYDVRRWFIEAGLQLDVGLLRQDFVVTGPGALSHTPLVDLAPFLGVGVSLRN